MLSWPRYEELRDHARSFASIGISAFDNFTLTGNGDPEQLNGQRVSASFLQRKLHLGYARARELFERLVDEGYADTDGRTGATEDAQETEGLDWVDSEFGGG